MSFLSSLKTRKPETDIWLVGIAKCQDTDFLSDVGKDLDIVWLYPDRPYTFIADPFAVWHDNKLYVFVEALDYRVKKGVIDCFVLDSDLNLLERVPVMCDKKHLSYPYVFKEDGEFYMVPESSRGGETWIYKATDFPSKWEKYCPVIPETPMIDASFIKHEDKWWVFYALPGEDNRPFRELHIASADRLEGTWETHSLNPVSTDLSLSRPGGRPFVHGGKIHLPVQDCRATYGAHVNILGIDTLTMTDYSATIVKTLKPEFNPPYTDGLHTFSGCGPVTLIDCKRIERSGFRKIIDWQRRLGRFLPFVRHL